MTDPRNKNEETRVPPEHINRSGFVGLLGLPNAGKSTLMNGALQVKLSIVSNKPQTTRQRILGVVNAPNLQVALVDTPGIHRARGRMQVVYQMALTHMKGKREWRGKGGPVDSPP